MMQPWLTAAGGSIFVVLGSLHALYTAMDVSKPRRFAPADMSLLEPMQKTHVRMRKDARNFWLSYLGFNFSHSLGAIVFGGGAMLLAFRAPGALDSPAVWGALTLIALIYAVLAYCFWFWIPLAGSLLAAALFAAAALV